MSESSESTIDELQRWAVHLKLLADREHSAAVDPSDQREVENAIAAGVAVLAGEEPPTPAVDVPERPILARDLLITTDLVLRALQAQ